jgi:predicted DCC family thiol-disulfide oxidoreductase YuxK
MLTIFYDGHCPLCTAEMNTLQSLDTQKKLRLEDIHAKDFQYNYPYIDPIEADKLLHGQLDTGQIIKGLDVTCLAWKLVEKHKWMQMLRWPVIRFFADISYRFFARYRHQISSFVTGKPRCATCQKDQCDL